jgi:hypothetical protein
MSRVYTSLFVEDDKLALHENDAGKYNLTIGDRITIFLDNDLDKFMADLNQLYKDHIARKEARRARKDNGAKEANPEKFPTHKAIKT